MGGGGGLDEKVMDTAEVVQISSLALLKILKHARAGVPMEVMGLMLGDFVDDYTIQVVDVFSMPQSGTGVSVEAVDDVYQQTMVSVGGVGEEERNEGEDLSGCTPPSTPPVSHPSLYPPPTTDGDARANWEAGKRRWVVPLSPRFRTLALRSRHPNAAGV